MQIIQECYLRNHVVRGGPSFNFQCSSPKKGSVLVLMKIHHFIMPCHVPNIYLRVVRALINLTNDGQILLILVNMDPIR